MAEFKVLIGILTWDAIDYVQRLLENLTNVPVASRANYHIHFHDQGSSPELVEKIQNWCKGDARRYFSQSQANMGFAKGHNLIFNKYWKKQSFDYYVSLNSDVTFETHSWLDRMIDYMEKNPDVSIAGPRINGIILEGERRGHGYEITDADAIENTPYTAVSGCLCIVRCRDIEELGLYDASFTPGYFEDADMVARHRYFGRKIGKIEINYKHAYLGKAKCTSALKRKELLDRYGDFQEKNRLLFLQRWVDNTARRPTIDTLVTTYPKLFFPIAKREITITGPKKGTVGKGTFDIGSGSRLVYHPTVQMRGGAHFEIHDGGTVTLEKNVVIGMFNWVQGNGSIRIGKNTIVGPHVTLLSTMHQVSPQRPVREQFLRKAFLDIGEDVFIGAGSTIAAGITLAKGTLISSNSFANRSTEPYSINGGVPIEKIGRRKDTGITSRALVVLATGNAERNNIYNTWTNLFLDMSITLRSAGIDLFFVIHPNSKGKAPGRLDSEHLFLRESHDDFEEILQKVRPDFICIWNGGTAGDAVTIEYARRHNIDITFGEMGWLPQKDTVCFDTKGVNCMSSVRDIDLGEVRVDPGFDHWKNRYIRAQSREPVDLDNFVFVPLQDEKDTNIYKYSPFKRMDDFVKYLHGRIPDKTIVVRPHPRGEELSLTSRENIIVRTDGSIYDWVYAADRIIGINSTVLIEATLTDKPVFGVGEGLSTGLGVIFDVTDLDNECFDREVDEEMLERRRKFLSFLVFQKQIKREKVTWLSELREKTPFCRYLKGE